MNNSEFETSDAPDAHRLVDEVPVLLPAGAQYGRMMRKRVANGKQNKAAIRDTTIPGAINKKPRKANPRTLNTAMPVAAEA